VIRRRDVDAPRLQIGTILREETGHFPMPSEDFRKLARNSSDVKDHDNCGCTISRQCFRMRLWRKLAEYPNAAEVISRHHIAGFRPASIAGKKLTRR
jgi:hypothetical protein